MKNSEIKITDVVNGLCYNCFGKTWYDMVTSVLLRKENAVMVEYVTDYGKTGYACLLFEDGKYSHSVASSDKTDEDFKQIKMSFDYAD